MKLDTNGSGSAGDRVLRLVRRVIRSIDVHSRRLSSIYDLTGPQLVCLRQLERGGPASAVDLARDISLSPATLCGILDRLETKGLVQRVRQAQDRRRISVSLTAAGRRALRHAPDPLQAEFTARFAALSPRQQADIERALAKLAELLDVDAPTVAALAAGSPGRRRDATEGTVRGNGAGAGPR